MFIQKQKIQPNQKSSVIYRSNGVSKQTQFLINPFQMMESLQ